MMAERANENGATDETAPGLPQLCTEAADHMARARVVLHDETLDADQALSHLDEAIACLQRLWGAGHTSSSRNPRLKSA